MQTAQTYFPINIQQRLLSQDYGLKSYNAASLFLDIKGFTKLVNQLSEFRERGLQSVKDFQEELFQLIEKTTKENKGEIQQFYGDGILILTEQSNGKALARKIISEVKKFNLKKHLRGLRPEELRKLKIKKISTKIGIGYGKVYEFIYKDEKGSYFTHLGEGVANALRAEARIKKEFGIKEIGKKRKGNAFSLSKEIKTTKNNKFSNYLPVLLREKILREKQIRPERRNVAIAFAKIWNFSLFLDKAREKDLEVFLNHLTKTTSDVAAKHQIFFEKFYFFNPMLLAGTPFNIVGKEVILFEALKELQDKLDAFLRTINNRFKINVKISFGADNGYVFAGTLGSRENKRYTVIGDYVNRAFRLVNPKKIDKKYQRLIAEGNIFLSKSMASHLKEEEFEVVRTALKHLGKEEVFVFKKPTVEQRLEEGFIWNKELIQILKNLNSGKSTLFLTREGINSHEILSKIPDLRKETYRETSSIVFRNENLYAFKQIAKKIVRKLVSKGYEQAFDFLPETFKSYALYLLGISKSREFEKGLENVLELILNHEKPFIVIENAEFLDENSLRFLKKYLKSGEALFLIHSNKPLDLHISTISIEGLDKERTAILVNNILGEQATAQVVKEVYQRTKGNPLYIKAIANDIKKGEFKGEAIEDSLMKIYDSLSNKAKEAAKLISCLERGFTEKIFPKNIVQELKSKGLVDVEKHKISFKSSLIRDLIYKTMFLEEKIKKHLKIINLAERSPKIREINKPTIILEEIEKLIDLGHVKPELKKKLFRLVRKGEEIWERRRYDLFLLGEKVLEKSLFLLSYFEMTKEELVRFFEALRPLNRYYYERMFAPYDPVMIRIYPLVKNLEIKNRKTIEKDGFLRLKQEILLKYKDMVLIAANTYLKDVNQKAKNLDDDFLKLKQQILKMQNKTKKYDNLYDWYFHQLWFIYDCYIITGLNKKKKFLFFRNYLNQNKKYKNRKYSLLLDYVLTFPFYRMQ